MAKMANGTNGLLVNEIQALFGRDEAPTVVAHAEGHSRVNHLMHAIKQSVG